MAECLSNLTKLLIFFVNFQTLDLFFFFKVFLAELGVFNDSTEIVVIFDIWLLEILLNGIELAFLL